MQAQNKEMLDQGQLFFLRDQSGELSIEDVRKSWQQQNFKQLDANLSKGYVPDVFWLRFELDVTSEKTTPWWLTVMPPFLDDIQLYHDNPFGQTDYRKGGDFLPQSAKEESYRGTVFKLQLIPGKHAFYLRLKTTSAMVASVAVWKPESFTDYERNSYFLFGLYFSLILTVFLFNVVNVLVSRKIIFLAYSGYLLLNMVQWLAIGGFISEFVFPEKPLLANLTLGVSLSLSASMAFLFFTLLFELKRYHPVIYKINIVGMVLGLLTAGATPLGYYQLFSPFMLMIALVSMASSGWILTRLWKTRLFYNQLLVVAHSCFILLMSINILGSLSLLPYSELTLYAGMVSNIFHIMILHFGLMLHFKSIEQAHLHSLEKARLAQQEIALEKKYNEEQTQLLAMLTHEIRTPIAVIDAATESLHMLDNKDTHAQEGRLRRYERIRKAVMRMNSILEMGLAQMEKERWPFDPGMTDIESLTYDVIDLTAPDANCEIIAGPFDEGLIAKVDKRLMNIAMLNLLDNAIKYSPDGSTVKIISNHRVVDGVKGICWSVYDEGEGINEAETNKIFTKGYRAQSSTGASGLGLGLYLVKRIAQQHGGEVKVSNKPDGGAVFSLWFPL